MTYRDFEIRQKYPDGTQPDAYEAWHKEYEWTPDQGHDPCGVFFAPTLRDLIEQLQEWYEEVQK